ncbi:MAG: helix-hairpin-helix domain-containing protein [Prevotella sp.]|nr:helix-hairpin-helix domain-containing protein [Prevotella sp.]
MRIAAILFLLIQCWAAVAEAFGAVAEGSATVVENDSWEQYLTALYENDEGAVVSMEEAYEHLNELAQQPLDVNVATQEELMQIPGLDQNQINDILQYIHRYGRMRSIEELAMIESIDLNLRNYLECFLVAEDEAAKPWYAKGRLRQSLRKVRQSLATTARVPTYYRAGDQRAPSHTYMGDNRYAGKYLGDPVSHSLRYSLRMGENVTFNLSGGKSAGEPFFGEHNRWGYDRYAFNLRVTHVGRFSQIILGHFRGQFGLGLVLNNNFTLGKQGMLAAVGRRLTAFSPHSSVGDSKHFQGAAVMMGLTDRVQLAAFFSYRMIVATLNADSTISTILTSNYHRTALEMGKKNNSAMMTTGTHLSYERRRWGIGVSAIYSWLNREINPTYSKTGKQNPSQLYRLHYPRGKCFWNFSADYHYRWRELRLNGETAIDKDFHLATINSMTWRFGVRSSSTLTLMAVQRYYTYQYNALFGSSFSDGGSVKNESGLYIGARWDITPSIVIEGYTDIAYFPWYKYLVSSSSYSWDNSITGTWNKNSCWSFSLRYRIKMKQRDKTTKNETNEKKGMEGTKEKALLTKYDHRLRLLAIYNKEKWSLRTQVEGCSLSFDETTKGYIIAQSASYKPTSTLEIYANAAWFNTDDYDSRLYSYERGVRYSFGSTSYYGKGIHAALMLKYKPLYRLTLQGKVGHTRYFDRETIGTAERMIFSSHYTDIELQVQVKM